MQTTLNVPNQELIPINELGNHYPRRANRATVFRHLTTGIKRGDRRVKLQTVLIGGRRYGRRDWIEEFIAELNRGDSQPSPEAIVARRRRQAEAAMTALQSR